MRTFEMPRAGAIAMAGLALTACQPGFNPELHNGFGIPAPVELPLPPAVQAAVLTASDPAQPTSGFGRLLVATLRPLLGPLATVNRIVAPPAFYMLKPGVPVLISLADKGQYMALQRVSETRSVVSIGLKNSTEGKMVTFAQGWAAKPTIVVRNLPTEAPYALSLTYDKEAGTATADMAFTAAGTGVVSRVRWDFIRTAAPKEDEPAYVAKMTAVDAGGPEQLNAGTTLVAHFLADGSGAGIVAQQERVNESPLTFKGSDTENDAHDFYFDGALNVIEDLDQLTAVWPIVPDDAAASTVFPPSPRDQNPYEQPSLNFPE